MVAVGWLLLESIIVSVSYQIVQQNTLWNPHQLIIDMLPVPECRECCFDICAPVPPLALMRRVSFVGRTRAGTSNHASTRPRACKFHLTPDLTTRFP